MSGPAPVPPTSSTMVGNLLSTFQRWNKVPDNLVTSFGLPRLGSPILIGGEVCTIGWNIVCVPFETLGKVVTSPFVCCSVRCKKISDWNKSLHPLSTVYKILKLVIGLIASAFLAWSIVSWNLRFHAWLEAGYKAADLSKPDDRTVAELKRTVAELMRVVTAANATIRDQDHAIANKDCLIDEKQGSVDFLKQFSATTIFQKDQQIAKLEAEIRSNSSSFEQEIATLKGRITDLSKTTQGTSEADEKASNAIREGMAAHLLIQNLLTVEKDQAAEILDLNGRIEQSRQTINVHLENINTLNATIVGHEQALSGKDEAIATLKQEIATLKSRIAELSQNVQATSEADSKVNNSGQIAQLQKALKDKEQELHSKISEISSLTGRITRLEEQAADLAEKEEQLIAKEAKLKAKEADQAEHQAQLDLKQAELDIFAKSNQALLEQNADDTLNSGIKFLHNKSDPATQLTDETGEDEGNDFTIPSVDDIRRDFDQKEREIIAGSSIPTVGSEVAGSSNVPTDSSAQSNNAEATDANGIPLAISSEAQQPNPAT